MMAEKDSTFSDEITAFAIKTAMGIAQIADKYGVDRAYAIRLFKIFCDV